MALFSSEEIHDRSDMTEARSGEEGREIASPGQQGRQLKSVRPRSLTLETSFLRD